jgi:hypothetical protein
MSLSFTILRNTPNLIYGEFAAIKSLAMSYGVATSPIRSLLTDYHIKGLAS